MRALLRRLVLPLIALCLAPVIVLADAAAPAAFQEGKQYTLIDSPSAPPDAKKVTVQEFFSYGCPHCFEFDPTMDTWLKTKPASVNFERVPDGLGHAEWDTLSRAYYAAQVLGVTDKIHKPLFDAIHVQNLPLFTLPNLQIFFAKTAGVAPKDFDDAANSFAVANMMRRADNLARADGVFSIPTLVVDGKYLISPSRSHDETLKVIDFVVDKSRKERKL